MSEILHIKNFGPIVDVKLELRKINIFIGDQGTGKSTIVKLFSAIKFFLFRDLFDIADDIENRPTIVFIGHLKNFGIHKLLQSSTEITLNSKDIYFEYSNLQISDKTNVVTSNEEKLAFNINYIPAERIMIPALADALFGLMQEKVLLPQLFLRFGNKYQSSRKLNTEFQYKEILNADFSHTNGIDYVILKDGSKIFLTDASSGMQSTIPLLVVLDSIYRQNSSTSKSDRQLLEKNILSLIIEEPELNLFPETQSKLLKYIVERNFIKDNFTNKEIPYSYQYKNNLYITTHSPYILTSLNNLLYAYETGKIDFERTNKIIPSKYWVNPEDVSAYRLLANGVCKSILNKDEDGTLIDAAEIDQISSMLNKEFDELIDIEIAKSNS